MSFLFAICTSDEQVHVDSRGLAPRPATLPENNGLTLPPEETRHEESHSNGGIPDIYNARFSNAGLLSTEPLELLALANEAITDRDALLACKRIAELSKHVPGGWMRESVAKCLARAYLLFGDVFPFMSRFPPVDAFFANLLPEELVQVAVIVEDHRKSELKADFDDERLDGLDSFPVTFFRSQPATSCTKDFHAEAVMLSDVETGQTTHLQELSNPVVAVGMRRGMKSGKTYYAKRLDEHVVVVICFPKSQREADDPVVLGFLSRLEQLFV